MAGLGSTAVQTLTGVQWSVAVSFVRHPERPRGAPRPSPPTVQPVLGWAVVYCIVCHGPAQPLFIPRSQTLAHCSGPSLNIKDIPVTGRVLDTEIVEVTREACAA